jgi:hypothetical protein
LVNEQESMQTDLLREYLLVRVDSSSVSIGFSCKSEIKIHWAVIKLETSVLYALFLTQETIFT